MKRSAVVQDLLRITDQIPMFRETICGISYTDCGAMGRQPIKDITNRAYLVHGGSGKAPHVYMYWKDKAKGFVDITTEKPGYKIFVGEDMPAYFSTENLPYRLKYLNVSNLDVSCVRDFSGCFSGYEDQYFPVELIGYEDWDTAKAQKINWMFEGFKKSTQNNVLDLSKWNFSNVKHARGTFENFECSAKTIKIKLPKWNMEGAVDCSCMFYKFGLRAKNIEIKNIENWKVNSEVNLDNFFYWFGPEADYKLDLSNWWDIGNRPKQMNSFASTKGTLFNIKLPQ